MLAPHIVTPPPHYCGGCNCFAIVIIHHISYKWGHQVQSTVHGLGEKKGDRLDPHQVLQTTRHPPPPLEGMHFHMPNHPPKRQKNNHTHFVYVANTAKDTAWGRHLHRTPPFIGLANANRIESSVSLVGSPFLGVGESKKTCPG